MSSIVRKLLNLQMTISRGIEKIRKLRDKRTAQNQEDKGDIWHCNGIFSFHICEI